MGMKTVFTSREAADVTGLTQRQLAYWRSSGLIVPSHQTSGGHARYSFSDLVALKSARQLLDTGVSVQKIRRSVAALTEFLPKLDRPLTETTLVAAGDIIMVFHEGAAFEAISGQEWVFPIAQMQRDIERLNRDKKAETPLQRDLFPDKNTAAGHRAESA